MKSDKADGEFILLIDAVHQAQATKVMCGWIRVGQDKMIETTGTCPRLNIIGTLNLTAFAIVTFNDRVSTRRSMFFFDELRKHYLPKQKIHLILEGAGYYRSEMI